MQYVTEEVAREIERAVEVITTDEKGFLREAALQYIRDNAPQDKVEGARYIRIVDGTSPTGVIGILTYDDGSRAPKFTPEGKTQSNWWELERCRRISALTAPEKPEPEEKPEEKPEPVKLYCVKPLSGWLTAGKVYESTDGWMTYDDDGRRVDSVCIREGHLFPLVSRPAKVGEWVLVVDAQPSLNYKNGDIIQVVKGREPRDYNADGTERDGWAYYKCEDGSFLYESEYQVLDGYDGRYEEQEQPKPNAALTDRIKHLETENRLLEAENAKLCAKIAAIRKAVESEG